MSNFRVLFIDSYDSFTYNVVRLIEQQHVDGFDSIHVTTIRNDSFQDIKELEGYLKYFNCVVVGPGPGNPVNGSDDVGIVNDLFSDSLKDLPILGICLGFQAMCLAQGCTIEELESIKHGQVYNIKLNYEIKPDTLFKDYPVEFKSTRYHSLHVKNIGDKIEPLAFTTDDNGTILMAAKVVNKNWYGVQYHPESCCSELGGLLMTNFLRWANEINNSSGRNDVINNLIENSNAKFQNTISKLDNCIDKTPLYFLQDSEISTSKDIFIKPFAFTDDAKFTLKLCDCIVDSKFIMASSSISQNRGEWSIIALPDSESKVFTHYDQLHKTSIYNWRDSNISSSKVMGALFNSTPTESNALTILNENKSSFWFTLARFMKDKFIKNNSDIPFIGGLAGILGYEMGNYVSNTIDPQKELIPDAKLVYVKNTIAINHLKGELYAISLNNSFPTHILDILTNIKTDTTLNWPANLPRDVTFDIQMPSKDDYSTAFNKCQEYIHRGDSYEVCLTTQTKITPSRFIKPWQIFQTLIQKNPAPFSSYFEFNDLVDTDEAQTGLCFISTSPERFLKWNDESCELRPIKGTVKKSEDMTFAKATEILKTPKEFGENLMILDLIRSDLYELLQKVEVEEFMSVEEYQTVYQLVSVIKGRFQHTKQSPTYHGLDVFEHSLPAGSMTGAPKKVTVELLQDDIEKDLNKHVNGGVRGIYSGVTGYWSVNNNSDWSVNIRCMYSYNGGQSWQIGAGGAVTVLSSLEGEREEMFTKLESALQVFM